MKCFLAFIFLITSFLAGTFISGSITALAQDSYSGELNCEIYTLISPEAVPEGKVIVALPYYIIKTKLENVENIKNYLNIKQIDVFGEKITFLKAETNLNKALKTFKVLSSEKTLINENLTVYNCVSKISSLKSSQKFNLQIAETEREIIVGHPQILGSF